jgi:hypothetical protein
MMNPIKARTDSLDKKKFFIHIGTPKTGSTSLEKFLYENRGVLKTQGYLYPEETIRGYGHHDIAYLASGTYPRWATPQQRSLSELINSLRCETGNHNDKKIILSSEIFYLLANPNDVAKVIESLGFQIQDVQTIVYLRRQDEAHQSWYNQKVKAQGYTGNIHDSIKESWELWDYQKSLGPWSKTFGKENIILRAYETESLIGQDIRSDFIHCLGIAIDKLVFSEENINSRLCRDLLEFQRHINTLPISFIKKRKYMNKLIELTNSSKDNDKLSDTPLLSIKQRKEIMNAYDVTNKYVAREYMNTDQLFESSIRGEVQDVEVETSLSLKKLSYILYWILFR